LLACSIGCNTPTNSGGGGGPGSDPPVVQITDITKDGPVVITVSVYANCWDYKDKSGEAVSRISVSGGGFSGEDAIGPYWPGLWPEGDTTFTDLVARSYPNVCKAYCAMKVDTVATFTVTVCTKSRLTGEVRVYMPSMDFTKPEACKSTDCPSGCGEPVELR
jgi:hypothetical protein